MVTIAAVSPISIGVRMLALPWRSAESF